MEFGGAAAGGFVPMLVFGMMYGSRPTSENSNVTLSLTMPC